jgi:hypothetical protein
MNHSMTTSRIPADHPFLQVDFDFDRRGADGLEFDSVELVLVRGIGPAVLHRLELAVGAW